MIIYSLLSLFTLLSVLIIYHHAGFPWLLKRMAQATQDPEIRSQMRHYSRQPFDQNLPSISLVIPAYNEAEWISDKILNLTVLDYPADKLSILIICDGCSDETVLKAYQTLQDPICHGLNITIDEQLINVGKTAVLNRVIPQLETDLVALSDVSALISADALLVAVEHFKNQNYGVLTGHYQLLNPGSDAEQAYWNYQSAIKQNEAKVASTMGTHGAFYLFRTALFQPLAAGTINDDFIIPMQIVEQGYQAAYDKNIHIIELEQASLDLDQNRRRRISAGNMQQFLRLKQLLHPKFGHTALLFFSGKVLRVLMPFFLLSLWVVCLLLAFESTLFLAIFMMQNLVYGYSFITSYRGSQPGSKTLKLIHYLVMGHYAGLVGSIRYLLGLNDKVWQKNRL